MINEIPTLGFCQKIISAYSNWKFKNNNDTEMAPHIKAHIHI